MIFRQSFVLTTHLLFVGCNITITTAFNIYNAASGQSGGVRKCTKQVFCDFGMPGSQGNENSRDKRGAPGAPGSDDGAPGEGGDGHPGQESGTPGDSEGGDGGESDHQAKPGGPDDVCSPQYVCDCGNP